MHDSATQPGSVFEAFKSLLVIPLVMAIVMGIGWGLVRLAAWRQATSGKPDAQPVGQTEDGSLLLTLPFAEIRGEVSYHRASGTVTLSNWKHADDSVRWRFRVDKPGRYAIDLDYSCDAKNAGSTVRVDLDDAELKTTIDSTRRWERFKTLRVGEVDISEGWHNLQIAPDAIAHDTVMVLRGVKLVPIKPPGSKS